MHFSQLSTPTALGKEASLSVLNRLITLPKTPSLVFLERLASQDSAGPWLRFGSPNSWKIQIHGDKSSWAAVWREGLLAKWPSPSGAVREAFVEKRRGRLCNDEESFHPLAFLTVLWYASHRIPWLGRIIVSTLYVSLRSRSLWCGMTLIHTCSYLGCLLGVTTHQGIVVSPT